ncbi:rab11 family-interacting protein 1 isoform X1 [Anguilla rostrata]|uniref:rab11 family-interacting protein 1 isoform X1 n=2 Tax=Anguilla rostrata TaxID=7938 RepID=UPI0030CFA040
MSLADQSQQWYPTSVKVTVFQARNLRIKGKHGTNDAYAIMQVAKERFSTAVAEKSVSPVWKQEASFDLPLFHHGNEERCTLRVTVMHRALVGMDKQLGQAVINLLDLNENSDRSKTEWFKLLDKHGKEDKERGEVLLDIQFMRNNMTASMFDLSGQGKSRSRMGKLKDKIRGKKGDLSDSASAIVPASSSLASSTQVMTDSEGEGEGHADHGADKKKKKSKIKSLFAPKSNLQRDASQSMVTLGSLPEKNSALSGSRSSGLNLDSPEGKKKFKFLTHKRTDSSDSKGSQGASFLLGRSKQGGAGQMQTPPANSTLSLSGSDQGSVEDLQRGQGSSDIHRYSEEEESREEQDMRRLKEEQERQREEKEKKRIEEEQEMRRLKEEHEKQMVEQERRREEQKKREEEQEMRRREEEVRRREEEEQLRRRKEEEELRRRKEEEMRRKEEEEEKMRKGEEEEEMRKKEEMRIREEEERMKKREEEMRRREEEELRRRKEEEMREEEEEMKKKEEMRRREEEMKRRREEEEMRRREVEEEMKKKEEMRIREEEEEMKMREEEEEMRRREEEELRRRKEEEMRRKEEEEEKMRRMREEEEEMKKKEEMIRREEEEKMKRRKEEEDMRRREEEEELRRRKEEEMREEEEEMKKKEEMRRKEEEMKRRKEEEMRRREVEEEMRKREEEEKMRRREEEEIQRREEEAVLNNLFTEVSSSNLFTEASSSNLFTEASSSNLFTEVSSSSPFSEVSSSNPFEESPRSGSTSHVTRSARISAVRPRLVMSLETGTDKRSSCLLPANIDSSTPLPLPHTSSSDLSLGEAPSQAPVTPGAPHIPQDLPRDPWSSEKSLLGGAESPPASAEKKRHAPLPPPAPPAQSQHCPPPKPTPAPQNVPVASARVRKGPAPPKPQPTLLISDPSAGEGASNLAHDGQQQLDDRSGNTLPANHEQGGVDGLLGRAVAPEGKTCETDSSPPAAKTPFDDDEDEGEAVSAPRSRGDEALCTVLTRSDPSSPPGAHTENNHVRQDGGSGLAFPGGETQTEAPEGGAGPGGKGAPKKKNRAPLPLGAPHGDCTTQEWDRAVTPPPSEPQGSKVAGKRRAPQPGDGALPGGPTLLQAWMSPSEPQPITMQNSAEGSGTAGKVGGAPSTSCRPHPVKPLSLLDSHYPGSFPGGDLGATEGMTKVTESAGGVGGPYSQLTHSELASLVMKQQDQLSEKDSKIKELEEYIDNLLVRIIEEQPSILQSMSMTKKAT